MFSSPSLPILPKLPALQQETLSLRVSQSAHQGHTLSGITVFQKIGGCELKSQFSSTGFLSHASKEHRYLSASLWSLQYHVAEGSVEKSCRSGARKKFFLLSDSGLPAVIEVSCPRPVWLLASVEAWVPGIKWNKCLFGEQLLAATAHLSHVSGICIWMWNVYLKMCSHSAAHTACSQCVYPIAQHRPALAGRADPLTFACQPTAPRL